MNDLNGKQRRVLKAMAQNIDPIVNIGKNGITENLIQQADEALEAREIVKFHILNNCELDSKAAAIELAEILGADYVSSIGRKFVLYRPSDNELIKLP
ncbi:MAG: ribosome assembly RNA-binding protein YhbY [Tissierellales bacterium]|jgi:RNA-binding protein|nr:ribosome assembly RNA-binding protein YhbY [Tissierellales bacterium]MBN2826987.1 ribosome assembly RNA-binding protein YhbY [Tissierellales bacterium]